MEHKLLSKETVKQYIKQAEENKVSIKSRSKDGFIYWYLNDGVSNKSYWLKLRKNFIKRTLTQYNKNPTYRRYLSLVMWAYIPTKSYK